MRGAMQKLMHVIRNYEKYLKSAPDLNPFVLKGGFLIILGLFTTESLAL